MMARSKSLGPAMDDRLTRAVGRAIVIESSLAIELPQTWKNRLLSRRVHRLDGLDDVTVLEYSVEPRTEGQVAIELAERLRVPGFYAHIIGGDSMIVAFPNTIFLLRRSDHDMIGRCRAYGRTLAIPDSQMQFERMFDSDHPDQVGKN